MSARLVKRQLGQLGPATTDGNVTDYLRNLGCKDSGKLSS